MDRFIVLIIFCLTNLLQGLKSNMDRFIENIAEYQLMFAVV